jgi:hypothetical protein
VHSLSDSWPAGVWLKETYVLRGACLKRVAVLIAVMIWRVTHSSAKLRKGGLLVGAEVADSLVEADQPLLDEVLGIAAGEKVGTRLEPDEACVAADQDVERRAVAVAGAHDEL